MEDSECLAEFRVHKRDIPVLADARQIPPTFRCRQYSVGEGDRRIVYVAKAHFVSL